MAFPADWTGYQELVIDNTKVSGSSDLTDYPLLIKDGNIPDAVYADLETDGKDVRFTSDSAGTTELAFEIVNIDTTAKTCQIWVKIPTTEYDADTSFYIWHGNSGASAYAVTDTYGARAVWSNGYKVVVHGDTILDSAQGLTITNDGVTAGNAGGVIDTELDFSDQDDLGFGSASTGITTAMSQEMWVNFHDDNNGRMFNKHGSPYGFSFWRWSGTDAFGGGISINGSDWNAFECSSDSAPTNTDIHAVMNYDNTNVRVYFDGVEDTGGSMPYALTGSINVSDDDLHLSEPSNNSLSFDGTIAEARLSNVSRTADWWTTQYANHNSPSTFLSAGDTGTPPTGVTDNPSTMLWFVK